MCNVKEVARSDKPTEKYHITLQFPSAQHFSVFQQNQNNELKHISAICCGGHNFTDLVDSHFSHQCPFQTQQAAVFSNKKSSYRPTV